MENIGRNNRKTAISWEKLQNLSSEVIFPVQKSFRHKLADPHIRAYMSH
jgi:hypothetical protein